MRVNNKRRDITFSDLMTVGEKFNIKKRKEIIKKIILVVDRFQEYAKRNHVCTNLISEVEKNRPRIIE
jgi:hypothetical protein